MSPEPDSDSQSHAPQNTLPLREHYIPVRHADLASLLCELPGVTSSDRRSLALLDRMLGAVVQHELWSELSPIKEAYAHFDPDAPVRPRRALAEPHEAPQAERIVDQVVHLLRRANFHRLDLADLHEALETMSDWGLNLSVDFDAFERLEVYGRGDSLNRRERRRWRRMYRKEAVDLPVYRRLAVIFRLRDGRPGPTGQQPECGAARPIYMKLFKNVPKTDVEMLLPGAAVRMTLLDRGRILLPTLSGLGIAAFKIAKGALLVATAGIYGVLAVVGLVGGTVGYGVRSFYGYLQTKQKYQLHLTTSLYYQTLGANAGVLFRLLDEAQEQECREGLLAYFFLWRSGAATGSTRAELDARIEAFLFDRLGEHVDFEIDDALGKLERWGLIERIGGLRFRALPLARALESVRQRCHNMLDQSWERDGPTWETGDAEFGSSSRSA